MSAVQDRPTGSEVAFSDADIQAARAMVKDQAPELLSASGRTPSQLATQFLLYEGCCLGLGDLLDGLVKKYGYHPGDSRDRRIVLEQLMPRVSTL